MQSSHKILHLKNKSTLNPLMPAPCPLLGGLQHSPDFPLPFYMPLARLFFVLQKVDAPIFFLYYPLSILLPLRMKGATNPRGSYTLLSLDSMPLLVFGFSLVFTLNVTNISSSIFQSTPNAVSIGRD